MALRNFNEWKSLNEGRRGRSQRDELQCPHPEDKEYCREWNKWIRGELKSPPVYTAPVAQGHWEGRRGGDAPTGKSVYRQKQREGEGRHKWRYRGDY